MKNNFKKIVIATLATLATVPAMAQEGSTSEQKGMFALAAGLAIGLAAVGGALGQAKATASALDGIARNPAAQPKIFVPMIIGLALIESLVIYAFVIAFLLQSKF
jgi:F-type H+-transporting ATPase subunit c